jgi:L-threonylcarbamoyladenylate synthase
VIARQTRVVRIDRDRPDRAMIEEAAALIRRGGLVVFPTETVYGLGAHALDRAAVQQIFEAKGRPSTDPLIVHVADRREVAGIAQDVPELLAQLADAFWPGPLTLILGKHDRVPIEVTAGLQTVAVRLPDHPVARALLTAAGVPVAAPSANLFSRPSPTRAAHVVADLDGRVDLVLDAGSTDIGVESTVLDLTVRPPRVRRPGGVSIEALRAIVPAVEIQTLTSPASMAQRSPGQLLRHYAPSARVTLFDGSPHAVRERIRAQAAAAIGRGHTVGILAPEEDIAALRTLLRDDPAIRAVVLQEYGARCDPFRCARELFDALRTLDGAGVSEILASAPEPTGVGLAVRDRLTRAAEGRIVEV